MFSSLKFYKNALLLGGALFVGSPDVSHAQDALIGLSDIAGGGFGSQAESVSGDGSVVVGSGAAASGTEAFRWTQAGGMVGLGDLPGGIYLTISYGVSEDGSVIVGGGSSGSGTEAFRWTQAGGMVGLGDLAGGGFTSIAYDVSNDGSVIVGAGTSASGIEAFRWTQAGGMAGLGDLAGGGFTSIATGVNSDGSVVVGYGESASGQEAFRWTQAGGMVGLGDLAGGGFTSIAHDASADGSVIVGYGFSANGQEAFRWTQAGGMVGLGDLAGGGFNSVANGVSADGSVVVGFGTTASVQEAFRWTQETGMQSVADWLGDAGVDTSGYSVIARANDVSDDGSVIVGYGTTASGQEAFLARVSVAGSGIINPTSFNETIVETQTVSELLDFSLLLPLNGAHHRPLADYALNDEGSCAWATTDGGYSNDNNRYVLNQEVGLCHMLSSQFLLGVGFGISKNRAEASYGGETITRGNYGLFEVNYIPEQLPVTLSMTAMAGKWNAEIQRGYENGGLPDISKGETDIFAGALKAGVLWNDAFSIPIPKQKSISISPKASYTLGKVRIDEYTETGGGFPVAFNDRDQTTREFRAGAQGKVEITPSVTLTTTLEAVYAMESKGDGVNGTVVGLYSFDYDGTREAQTWGRLGMDVDYVINDSAQVGTSLFVATGDRAPDISGAAGLKVSF